MKGKVWKGSGLGRPKRLLFSVMSVVCSLYIYANYKLGRVLQLKVEKDRRYLEQFDAQVEISNPESLSSVDYMACCGAGHRMSKLSEAHYLSKQLGFSLRVYWGYCDTMATRQRQTEVFQ